MGTRGSFSSGSVTYSPRIIVAMQAMQRCMHVGGGFCYHSGTAALAVWGISMAIENRATFMTAMRVR